MPNIVDFNVVDFLSLNILFIKINIEDSKLHLSNLF